MVNIKIIECYICGNEFRSYGETCNEKEQVCSQCCSSGWCDMCK
ncbi:hypothetical protein PM10SUCC1_14710 [Propionigenium maris DSM 9537]|uniref:Uncharacterized protein n=1 Tax=Propionigenium maris DSM 9537 TaxID=1123000 RepID=A0A9W6GKN0_9FUSO|nr:hypothetical protein PM10SUCC1_14710 [Propionigenium maris DSM 9537]